MPQRQTKEDKDRFFAGLDQLDDSTTESEDEIEALVQCNKSRMVTSLATNHRRIETTPLEQESRKLAREGSFEAPIIIYDTPKTLHEGHSTSIKQPGSPTRQTSTLQKNKHQKRPIADHPNVRASLPKKSKKAKDTIELVAKEQRIFAKFNFCTSIQIVSEK